MTVRIGQTSSYRVRARNTSTASENRIHSDDVAAQYGFRGGLVPGVTVYAYMTRPVVDVLGAHWVERGTMSARFNQPFYEGDEVVAAATLGSSSDDRVHLDLEASRDGEACATGTASLPSTPGPLPDLARYPSFPTPPPDDRPPATPDVLRDLPGLSLPPTTVTDERLAAYRTGISDDSPVYDADERSDGVVHPGYLLRFANTVLSANVRLGPWIHVSSDVCHHGIVRAGCRLTTRAVIVDLFERKGHKFVSLDVVVLDEERGPVFQVLHTAIYDIAPRA